MYVIYFYMAKLPNIKRRNNRVAVLKVYLIAVRLAYQMKKSLEFCEKLKSDGSTENFWRNSIRFYLDGTGFVYKQNPKDQTTALKA